MRPVFFAICLLAVPAAAADTSPDDTATSKETDIDSVLLSRTAYDFPLETYDEWLAFMDRAEDPAWQAPAMRSLVTRATYERYRDGATVRAEKLVYESDGLRINAFALAPVRPAGALPVVLFAHGGVAEWGRITFFDLLEMYRLAERGYLVLASALRGEGGSEGTPNLGRGDRADFLRMLDVAREMGNADLDRIGLWGFSRGGGLGYRVLASTDAIDAAVLVGAPSDLVNSARRKEFHENVYPGVVDNYARDPDTALEALSAAYWPERLAPDTPILLIHGAADERVPVEDSLAMAGHLARLSRPFALTVVVNASHSLVEHQERYREEVDRWFERYLRCGPSRSTGTDNDLTILECRS